MTGGRARRESSAHRGPHDAPVREGESDQSCEREEEKREGLATSSAKEL
jgi:hypothetical protein